VTTRDDMGRSSSESDLNGDPPPTRIDPTMDWSEVGVSGNGGPRYGARVDQGQRGSHASTKASTKASTAYEVAAALRAQASRAAQATREAGRRVQDALSTQPDPGAVVANSVTKPVDTPESAESTDAPIGAAAAMAATAPTAPSRTREEPSADPEPELLVDEHMGFAGGYPTEPEPFVSASGSMTEVSEPAPAEEAGTSRVSDPVAPEAAALAPVVAPVVVPAAEPGVVAPVETQVSLDARPEATLAPQPPPVPRPAIRRGGRVRKARLRLMRVDPWSVMKTAFLLSIAFAVVTVVAVTVVWNVLQAAGVYDSISRTVTDVLGSASDTRFDLEDYIGLQRVLGFTALICVVDVVLITAIATLCAFLYNLSASLLGGLEVTLAEED
jgi:Transmembrane domain of unknown function (DUF3566)